MMPRVNRMAAVHGSHVPAQPTAKNGCGIGHRVSCDSIRVTSVRETIYHYRAPVYALFAATPLLDLSIGAILIFPVYEKLANLA